MGGRENSRRGTKEHWAQCKRDTKEKENSFTQNQMKPYECLEVSVLGIIKS